MVSIKTVILFIVAVVVIMLLLLVFLTGTQQPFAERRIFAAGCINYCQQIKAEASEGGEPLDIVAVRKARELQNSEFMRACAVLYPDTAKNNYLCWNRGCCNFELRPP